MNNLEKPHYIYIQHIGDEYALVCMRKDQTAVALPLNAGLAMKFAKDFLMAAQELHRKEVTQAGNNSTQMELLNEERTLNVTAVREGGEGSGDHPQNGGVPPVTPI